jgi:eukaryotic-like serine/threonine-protein kinase
VDDLEPAGRGYLAPELVGDAGTGPRYYTDIYGLGLILYELLTGRPPFRGADAHEVLGQVRSEDPIPPSRLNPKVPPSLEGCYLDCLRKNPWRRYHRVYDLLMRLRCLQDNLEGGA